VNFGADFPPDTVNLRVLLPFLLIAFAAVHAEDTMDLNLQKAIQLALAKNFRIKVSEFDPKIAKAQQKSTSGKFDPVLGASYTYDKNDRELRTLGTDLQVPTLANGDLTSDLFARQDGTEIDTSITGLLPWGLTYDIGPTLNIDNDNRRDPQFTRYDSFFGLTLTQPLLKNFGTDVNLADIRIARADRAISQWQLRQQVIDVVTDTISIYCELYFSIENLAVERRSRALAAQLLTDNEKRAEIGVMSPLDVLQAKADLASREERVIVAERAVFDNENFLKQLVSDEITRILDTHLNIVAPELPDTTPPDRKRDFAHAFEVRPDYRQALLDIQKRQITVVFTRNQALPRLDLTASYGVNGIDTGLASSFERASGQSNHNTAWSVGAIFSVPIPNQTGVGNLEVSKLEALRALVNLKRLEQAILVEADNAAGQIETTRKRVEATRIAREFAERTLAAAQTRLASGTSTTFEVLQFQRDLATAEANEFRARADFIKAVAFYARLTGTTLERNRIILE
jgi:outer membrane protein TolC